MIKAGTAAILILLFTVAVSPTLAAPAQSPAPINQVQQTCARSFSDLQCGENLRKCASDLFDGKVAEATPVYTGFKADYPTSPTTNVISSVPQTQTSSSNLNPDTVFALVNEQRAANGLPPFQKNEEVCQIAKSRGPELNNEVATGTLHSGLYNRNLPYWVTENMKYGGNEQEAVNWWLNSPVHRQALLGGATYSCVECVGNTCAQLFTSFSPK